MGCIKFESALHEGNISPSVKSTILKFKRLNPIPVVDFTNAVVDRIKATNTFELDSEEEIYSLSETLRKLVQDNKMLSQDLKRDILAGYENVLFKAFNIDPETSIAQETDKDLILENQPEDISDDSVTSEGKVLDYSIDRIYGPAARVKEYMLNQFRSGIVNASLVNFRERKRIKTVRDLNLYIAKYKNELFKKVYDYLKKEAELDGVQFDSALLDYIYNDSGVPDVSNMNKVMQLADLVLYKLNRETLSSAFRSRSLLTDGEPKNRLLVDAFNAYVILSQGNFDKILSRLMGKDFVIKKIYKGETDIKNEKYKFKSANAYRKTWKNSENIDAISEIGSVPKLLIEQTPLINHLTGLPMEDTNLTLKQFLYTMNKLVDTEYIRKFPETLRQIAVKLNTAPNFYLKKMLDIIMSPDYNTINRIFSSSDMNVLRSIYERFYNSGRPDSLYNIMLDEYQHSPAALQYDLLEVISGVVSRTNSSKYVQYALNRDLDDMLSYEIMQSNSLRKRLQREFDMEVSNKLRTDRGQLMLKYNIKLANQTTGDISFEIKVLNDTYEFTFVKDGKVGQKLRVKVNGKAVALSSVMQEPSFADLKNFYERNLSSMIMSQKEVQVYTGLVGFVDDMLNTGFLRGNSDLLEAYKGVYEADNTNYLTDSLMYMAADAALINYVYQEFENLEEYETVEAFAKTLTFYNNIPDDATWKKYYDLKSDSLKVININLDPLDHLASAEQMVSGEMYKTVTKNAEGNNIPTNRISNLANQTRYYLQTRVLDNPNSSIRDNLFAISTTDSETGQLLHPNILNIFGVNIKTDAISRNGVKKSAPNFTEAEHGYTSIMLDFFGNLIAEEDPRYKITGGKKGSANFVQIQPTVYSDKNTFYMWRVGTIYTIQGLDGKSYTLDLSKAKPADLDRAIKDTIGRLYKKTYDRVFSDYRAVLSDPTLGLGTVNSSLLADLLRYAQESNSKPLLRAYENIIKKQAELSNVNSEILQKNLEIAALNEQHAIEVAEALAAGDFMTFYEPIEPLKLKNLADLLTDQEVLALLSVMPLSTYNSISSANGIRNIENLHTNKTKRGKVTYVKPNHLLLYNVTKLYSDDKVYDKWMLREKKRFVKDLIQFNLSFPLVYSDGKVNKVLQQAIKKFGGAGFEAQWVNPNTKELIIAKQNGVPITRLNPITDIRSEGNIELNPLLEKYFLSDFLISENLRILTTGFELAHPDKSKAGEALTLENAELEEASRAGGQYKRNVIITATKQCMQQGSLMGITPTMRIAVMPDVQAKVYNINGVSGEVDAHDGSAFNNPLWAVLENLALQDAAVGEDKKPIGHDFTEYGTARLLKFATFSQYNERLRKSQLSTINMYDKFRSMNSDIWETFNDGIPVNLTRNLFGNTLTLKDILDGSRLFFRDGNKHYEILSLESTGNPNEYVRTILEVDVNGNVIRGTKVTESPILINTNFALHAALGGVLSESLVEDTLSYSDASIYATVGYVNNVGLYDLTNGGYPSQTNTRQPLKHAMIAYMVNKSAMKVGVENLNFESIWDNATAEELATAGAKQLNTMTMQTDGLGMQMDADHIVTDPEHQSTMTEFSQVISALEANGTVHNISKQAYRDLGKVALAAIADVLEAIKEFMDSDFSPEGKSKIYEIVGTYIIKELNKDGKNLGLSQSIVAKVKEEFAKRRKNHSEDPFKIPFSDPSIFGKALAGFTSAINSTAIKRKFPGMGAVMAPAYNMMMNFNIKGLDMSYDDIYKLAAELGQTPREYLDGLLNGIETEKNPDGTFKHLGTIDKVLPNDIVRVADKDGNIVLGEDGRPLEFNILDYPTYRMVKDTYTHFFPVISKPKNLKPMDIHWRTLDGRLFNLYDLPQVKYAFNIRGEYKSRKEKVPKELDLLILKGINDSLALLEAGFMTVDPTTEGATNMTINGATYSVVAIEPGSLVNNPAEVILSKIYAERFNLGPQDTLHDVMSQGAEFFIKKHELYHKPKTSNYDVCLTKGNGKHTYIVFLNSGVMKNLSANKDESSENYVRDGDNLYRIDEDGNKMYRAGAYDESDNLTMLVESYSTTDADSVEEVLVVKNIEQVLELYGKEYDGVVLNKNAESIKDTIFELIRKGAEERQGDFVRMARFLTDGIKYRDYVATLKSMEEENIRNQAKKKFVSFLKSLEYTVARIPAQTLQSFMKMKAVLFSDSDKNVVYVTHWQTWLQGSDYDIDKAYIMGYDFDDNGIYVGWSPFFNYSSINSLKKSEELPSPNGNIYEYADSEDSVDITEYLQVLNADNFRSEESLPYIVDMLTKIDNSDSKTLSYDSSVVTDDNANYILNRINEHNQYMNLQYDERGKLRRQKGLAKIYAKNILPAFRNSVSSKISRIILDIKNANSAYTPINMDDPQAAASKSALGKEAVRITATSPSSKWTMTVQNMSGKLVIGITAVGEKIFFAACYYFNEGVQRGDSGWFNNAFFQNVINKVQTTPMLDKNGNLVLDKDGKPKRITVESMRNIIANVNFNWNPDQKAKWEGLITEIMTSQGKPILEIQRTLQEQLGLQSDQSLVISALLSAATDNAKELILDKINAGPTLAGVYLHLIMLNYSFEDIANFMISPTVQTIKDLSKTNIFDDYHDNDMGIIDTVCNELENGPNINKYLDRAGINAIVYNARLKGIISKDATQKDYFKELKKIFESGEPLTTEYFPATTALGYRYIEEFNFLQALRAKLDMDTFETFRLIKEEAKETTMLGRGFGLNLGMKTDVAGKLSFLDALEKVIKDAEKNYDISDMESFVDSVRAVKSYLSPEYISDAYSRASELGIVNDFSIETFLNPENVEYRQATFDYHNCLKKIWPFFDMIDKIPHYKALYNVLYMTELTDSHLSNKYKLIKRLKQRLIEEKGYNKSFNQEKLGALASAVDEILITNWLSAEGITFTLNEGDAYFTDSGVRQTIELGTETFNLATDEGRATFKLWMESKVIPELKQGMIDGKRSRKIRTNPFLQGLLMAKRIDNFTKDLVNYVKLPIDMLNIKTESDQANFDKYKSGLSSLKSESLLGRPLTDWFFLYNLIVNGNMFGSDRLTTIFGDFLSEDNDSIILKYQTAVGDADYFGTLDMENFVLDDLSIKLAPITPKNQIYKATDQYIRVYDSINERYELRKKQTIAGEVEEEVGFEDYVLADPGKSVKLLRDYYNYFILRTPKQSERLRELVLTEESDFDDIVGKIRNLMKRNTLELDINCE